MLELLRDGRRLRLVVQLQREPARAAPARRQVLGDVVEQRDRAVGAAAGVVLEVELRPRPQLVVRALPAEPPEDLAGVPVELVDRARVAGGDDEVPVAVERHGVEMERVVRLAALLRGGPDRLRERDRPQRVPLEQDRAAVDVDLLDDVVLDDAVAPPAELRQIPGHRLVGDGERGAARGELELVRVHPVAVAHPDGRHRAVAGVDDPAGAIAAVERHAALPPGQDRLAVERLAAEVEGLVVAGERVEPDRLPLPVEDQRPLRAGPALGRDEDRVRGGVGRRGDDLHRGRAQVGARREAVDPLVSRHRRVVERRRRRVRGGRDHERGRVAVRPRDRAARVDADALLRRERLVGHERRAVAVRMRAPAAAVRPGHRAGHRQVAEIVRGGPADDDRRPRQGGHDALAGIDADRRRLVEGDEPDDHRHGGERDRGEGDDHRGTVAAAGGRGRHLSGFLSDRGGGGRELPSRHG